MQSITILGSTGSIGVSTLDVLARHPDRFQVYALSAHTSVDALLQQCKQFRPQVAVVAHAEAALRLEHGLRALGLTTEVAYGPDALCRIAAASECDAVMAAIVGAAGLPSTLAAAHAGKKILLANKEALVMAGSLLIDAVAASGASLLPIDSEHNAIFQCLPHDYQRLMGGRRKTGHAAGQEDERERQGIAKIVLTASGGPFLLRDVNTLEQVTPEEAVAHPKWVMGQKISVDSATMMNKGLEVIEAHWLFDASADQIEVLIHPQSVIHSMVSYVDGSVLAQLGNPDMRTPIAHALAWPQRLPSGVAQLDLAQIGQLSFMPADLNRFPCLRLAYDALRAGGSASAILNAANEVAVRAFLNREIGFRMIDRVISTVMERLPVVPVTGIDMLFEQDRVARAAATACLHSHDSVLSAFSVR